MLDKSKVTELFGEIKEILTELDVDISAQVSNEVNVLKDFFEEMFEEMEPKVKSEEKSEEKPKPERKPEAQDEIIYRLTEELIKEVKELDSTHVGWLRAYVEMPNEDYIKRSQTLKADYSPSETLGTIFIWEDTPLGKFYWKSIHVELYKKEQKGTI